MVRLSPIAELRAMFASDGDVDHGRMRRLAIIITLRMTDSAHAEALHSELESAIMMFENVREDGRFLLEMLAPELDAQERPQ